MTFCLTFVATELINKLNFLDDEDQEVPPALCSNPFEDLDDDLHPNHLNPFDDPDDTGMHVTKAIILVDVCFL